MIWSTEHPACEIIVQMTEHATDTCTHNVILKECDTLCGKASPLKYKYNLFLLAKWTERTGRKRLAQGYNAPLGTELTIVSWILLISKGEKLDIFSCGQELKA